MHDEHAVAAQGTDHVCYEKPPGARLGRFFFQAEDGIRDADVTGVQTCALPISPCQVQSPAGSYSAGDCTWQGAPTNVVFGSDLGLRKIGRASCRERV